MITWIFSRSKYGNLCRSNLKLICSYSPQTYQYETMKMYMNLLCKCMKMTFGLFYIITNSTVMLTFNYRYNLNDLFNILQFIYTLIYFSNLIVYNTLLILGVTM